MQERVLPWGIFYLGILVGGLLVIGLMTFFFQGKDDGR
jgi:hypothetical protein